MGVPDPVLALARGLSGRCMRLAGRTGRVRAQIVIVLGFARSDFSY